MVQEDLSHLHIWRRELVDGQTYPHAAAQVESGYGEQFLKHVWQDTLGYAGTELIRRAIGFSHVADLASIAEPQARHACQRHAVELGKTLILTASDIPDVAALLARVRQSGT